MATSLIQKTEDRGQRTEVWSWRSRALNKCTTQWHSCISLLTKRLVKQLAIRPSNQKTVSQSLLLPSVFCFLIVSISPLTAEELTDPTRPPAEIGAASATMSQEGQVDSGLQSVIISPNRRAAIINGKVVELGEKYGGNKLIEVNERGVVLQGKQGKQSLALFPGVQMKIKNDKSANKAAKPVTPEEGK